MRAAAVAVFAALSLAAVAWLVTNTASPLTESVEPQRPVPLVAEVTFCGWEPLPPDTSGTPEDLEADRIREGRPPPPTREAWATVKVTNPGTVDRAGWVAVSFGEHVDVADERVVVAAGLATQVRLRGHDVLADDFECKLLEP